MLNIWFDVTGATGHTHTTTSFFERKNRKRPCRHSNIERTTENGNFVLCRHFAQIGKFHANPDPGCDEDFIFETVKQKQHRNPLFNWIRIMSNHQHVSIMSIWHIWRSYHETCSFRLSLHFGSSFRMALIRDDNHRWLHVARFHLSTSTLQTSTPQNTNEAIQPDYDNYYYIFINVARVHTWLFCVCAFVKYWQ